MTDMIQIAWVVWREDKGRGGEWHTLEHGADCPVLVEHAGAGTGGLLTSGGLAKGQNYSNKIRKTEDARFARSTHGRRSSGPGPSWRNWHPAPLSWPSCHRPLTL